MEIRERFWLFPQRVICAGPGVGSTIPEGPFQLRIFHDSVLSAGVLQEGFADAKENRKHKSMASPAAPRAQECPCLCCHCQSSLFW